MVIKVACIGNMNNNMFALVRYLRDFDIDADLVLFNDEIEHFLPYNDSFQESINYIKKLSWGDSHSFFRTPVQKIKEDLAGYNVLIGCSLLPAFLNKAGMQLHLFIPHGSDLYDKPFFNKHFSTFSFNVIPRIPRILLWSYYQRKGIRRALLTISEGTNKYYMEAIKALGIKDYFFINVPMLYSPEYEDINSKIPQLKYSHLFTKLRNNYDVVIFHHFRQNWKTFVDKISFKGNNIMIEGFADYVKQAKKKAVLVLFEYGIDVCNSKQLISELGIENSVVWMPKMPRKEIMFGLSLADFGSDDLLKGGFGGAGWEVMASGKPLFINLSWIAYEEFKSRTGKPFPPIINARTPQDITKHLLNYEKNPDDYKKVGLEARVWFDRYMGRGLAEKYVYLIKTIAKGEKIDSTKLRFN